MATFDKTSPPKPSRSKPESRLRRALLGVIEDQKMAPVPAEIFEANFLVLLSPNKNQ
jgi:hypothetical protein